MKTPALSRAAGKIAFVKRRAVDFIFPPLCILCDTPRLNHRWLCGQCRIELNLNNSTRTGCPRCGQNRSTKQCACEFVWDYPFDRIVALLDYTAQVQHIAHFVKYRGLKSLVYDIGYEFASHLPGDCFESIDVALAVPLHWRRRLQRGYNQAEWFARGLLTGADKREIPLLSNVLRRSHHTKTQTKLTKEERQANLSSAFSVTDYGKNVVKGKKVALFDDVVTTGSTVAACTAVLMNAGCESVRIVALARD